MCYQKSCNKFTKHDEMIDSSYWTVTNNGQQYVQAMKDYYWTQQQLQHKVTRTTQLTTLYNILYLLHLPKLCAHKTCLLKTLANKPNCNY